jgi:hypothetical protein
MGRVAHQMIGRVSATLGGRPPLMGGARGVECGREGRRRNLDRRDWSQSSWAGEGPGSSGARPSTPPLLGPRTPGLVPPARSQARRHGGGPRDPNLATPGGASHCRTVVPSLRHARRRCPVWEPWARLRPSHCRMASATPARIVCGVGSALVGSPPFRPVHTGTWDRGHVGRMREGWECRG